MANFTNILISAKDYENYSFLANISVYKKSCILNIFFEDEEMQSETYKIKNQHFLNIINAFLAEAKKDGYNLKESDFRENYKDSDYCELYENYIKLILYSVVSYIFGASLLYNEIKLINLREY